MHDVYLTDDSAVAAVLLDKAIAARDPTTLQHLEALAVGDPRPPSNKRLERSDRRAQPV